jgi:hypothetical protein
MRWLQTRRPCFLRRHCGHSVSTAVGRFRPGGTIHFLVARYGESPDQTLRSVETVPSWICGPQMIREAIGKMSAVIEGIAPACCIRSRLLPILPLIESSRPY